jgi:carbamate kinase
MNETILVALGGNALIRDGQTGSFDEQLRNAHDVAERLVAALGRETQLVVAHGNGPQVGNLLSQNDVSDERIRQLPLFGCNAASQGLVGALLGLALNNEFARQSRSRRAVPMLTPVVVTANAPINPTKPIGPFYDAEEATQRETAEKAFREDAGRGWRRVVPSPEPERVASADQIRDVVDNGNVPVAVGGGGLPVLDTGENFDYVNAVVDKDLAAARLAQQLEADRLVILTDVEHVMLEYGTEDETAVETLDASTARQHLVDGQFERGSMYEKVKAACQFVESDPDRRATITSLDRCDDALDGTGGTQFVTDDDR